MPSCAVKWCSKYSRMKNNSNSNIISYHRFPRDPKTRDKWIMATGHEEWLPPKKATICSVHFEKKCFVEKGGHTFLKNGSVPTLNVFPTVSVVTNNLVILELDPCADNQNKETKDKIKEESLSSSPNNEKVECTVNIETQSNHNICRMCLATDRKMYPIVGSRVKFYEQVTGLTFSSEDLLPKYLCWECGYYMSKYVAFKNRAVTSHSTLIEILNKDGLITKTSVVNCKGYESTLTRTNIVYLIAEKAEEKDNLQSEIKIKTESNELNDNFIDFVDVPEDINNDFKDESLNKAETLSSDDFIGALPNIEATEPTKENSNIKKQPTAKLPTVKRKKKDQASELTKDKKNSNEKSKISNKITKLARVRRKKVSTVKEKKDVKSRIDELDKELLHITELTMDEQIAALQNRKESKNYKNSPYICDNCFRGFLDIAAYERHMTKYLESRGPHICPLCRARFRKITPLKDHMKAHAYRISCLKCSFTTNYILVAKSHQKYHQGKTYKCLHCNEVFGHQSSYLSHLRLSHPSDVICKHCGCAFLNERGLNQHILWNHSDDQNQIPLDGPVCARCDIRFSCQDALDTHRRVSARHADERTAGVVEPARNSIAFLRKKIKYRSETNGKRYYSSELFPGGPKPCELCEVLLPSPKDYFFHIKKFHNDKKTGHQSRICEVCGKLFRTKENLRSHQFIHSSSKQFKCDRCGKLFQLEGTLYQHRTNHCGSRVDYPCSVCGKTISSKANLQRHMQIHKGLSYKCEYCGKVFGCQDNRRQHILYVHKKRPWPRRSRGLRRQAERPPETVVESAAHEAEVDMDEEWNSP